MIFNVPTLLFQSAGRIIGWLKFTVSAMFMKLCMFQSAGRIIGWLKSSYRIGRFRSAMFQSAGRIIGWLKSLRVPLDRFKRRVSIRRADYWLVEGRREAPLGRRVAVSIRRADYWLVEAQRQGRSQRQGRCFNPPGGLLVG